MVILNFAKPVVRVSGHRPATPPPSPPARCGAGAAVGSPVPPREVPPVTIEANPTAAPHLHRGALGLPEVVFQGITHIAPSLNIVFTFPIIALKAGPDMLISFLLTTIVRFFIGNTVSQFSKFMPSSGGYYSFATRGLGTRSGFMTT